MQSYFLATPIRILLENVLQTQYQQCIVLFFRPYKHLEQPCVLREFLALSEDEQFEYLTGIKLNWFQKLKIKFLTKWWSYMKKSNPHLEPHVLWESIYKGRF